LANAYAQTLGTVFTTESKPLEVELVVAEVGRTAAQDQLYRISYDGSVADEQGVVVMGGQADQLGSVLRDAWQPGLGLGEVLRLAVRALGSGGDGDGPRATPAAQLEVDVLDRTRPRRALRRLSGAALEERLAAGDAATAGDGAPSDGGPSDGAPDDASGAGAATDEG